LFDPEGFLTVARDLSSKAGASEAELRTAVSRAYYAVFLKARSTQIRLGRMAATGGGDEHFLVIQCLRGQGGPQGDQLDKLRKNRGVADYVLDATVDMPLTNSQVSLAGYLFNRV
jgi:hypothetical protein